MDINLVNWKKVDHGESEQSFVHAFNNFYSLFHRILHDMRNINYQTDFLYEFKSMLEKIPHIENGDTLSIMGIRENGVDSAMVVASRGHFFPYIALYKVCAQIDPCWGTYRIAVYRAEAPYKAAVERIRNILALAFIENVGKTIALQDGLWEVKESPLHKAYEVKKRSRLETKVFPTLEKVAMYIVESGF